jgi:hypothetical protein
LLFTTKSNNRLIRITVNKKKYKGVYRWEDLTLQRFCDLAAIAMPPGYEAYILADGKFDSQDQKSIDYFCDVVSKLTDKELKEDFPAYYRKVINCLTDIPLRVINELDNEKVENLYEYYLKPFVCSLLYHFPVIRFMGQITQYEPQQIKVFRLGGRFYYLPQSITLDGQEIPLANEPILSYSEASDIFRDMKVSKDDVNRLAQFMAIYCRRFNEPYSDKNVLERQHLFMQAKMSVVWGVFFYTCERISASSTIIRLFGSLPKAIHEVREAVDSYRNLVTEHSFTR